MKLIITFIFVLLFALSAQAAEVTEEFNNVGAFSSNAITGSAANAYPATAQLEWSTAYARTNKAIYIKNTDGTDGLTYKITYQLSPTGLEIDLNGSVDVALAAGADAVINFSEFAHVVNVYIKNTVADSIATFSTQIGGRS